MATRTASLQSTNVSDALFRAWINEIHNSLIAFGWIQTSDTGQINFATITRPVTTNSYVGYAIYRMNDSLQSTCAVYMRIDFGTAAANTDTPGIKVQVTIGGTDGAGTLTGNKTASNVVASGIASTTAENMRNAGSSSSWRMFWCYVASNNIFGVAVERDLDTSGNETANGVNVCWLFNKTTGGSQFLETAGGTGPAESKWYSMISSQSSQAGGGNVGVGPVRCTLGPFRNPMKTLLLCSKSDFVTDTTNPVTIYGASHTYLKLGASSAITSITPTNGDPGILMLWE